MKKPVVINLTGAPGAGKSTGAAKLFYELKTLGINCELVSEFAKDKTWEHNATALNCQEYIFGKQSYKLKRCRDEVDVIITDSPLPLTIIYTKDEQIKKPLTELVLAIYNSYDNINFFINRVKPYNPKGRNQTEAESDQLGPLSEYISPLPRTSYPAPGYAGISSMPKTIATMVQLSGVGDPSHFTPPPIKNATHPMMAPMMIMG